MKKQRQKPELIIPSGYTIDEMLDIDDGDFDEEPALVEEVKIIFERNENNRKK